MIAAECCAADGVDVVDELEPVCGVWHCPGGNHKHGSVSRAEPTVLNRNIPVPKRSELMHVCCSENGGPESKRTQNPIVLFAIQERLGIYAWQPVGLYSTTGDREPSK